MHARNLIPPNFGERALLRKRYIFALSSSNLINYEVRLLRVSEWLICISLSLQITCVYARAYPWVTTVFVDTRLSKRKHPRKRFQNFRQSCVLSTDRIEIHQSQPLVWPSDLLYVKKWYLIQNQSLLCQMFKERPIISYDTRFHVGIDV